MAFLIAPSILSADLVRLEQEVSTVIEAGADLLHIDVMDNHYVPTLTFGPTLCAALHRHFPKLSLDVHLMASPVDDLIIQFAKAGASRISIHPEASIHLERSLALIRQQGCQAGLVFNPATSTECLEWCLHQLNFVLVMTVNPGFAGQALIPAVLPKIKKIRACYPTLPISVDGGVQAGNIASLAQAGATEFVIGSALFSSDNYAESIAALRKALSTVKQS